MLFKAEEALIRQDRAPIDKNRSLLLPNRSKSDYLGVTHGLPGAYMQPRYRQYSRDKVPRWLNRKVITCVIKLWPVVAVGGR